MSFDYDKIAQKSEAHGSWWTSYADLFMMLSIVFLLMYVVSSLRSGTAGLQQQQQYQDLQNKSLALEEQIKVYNTLKDQQLQQENQQEQQVYQKLMSHLDLLKDQADQEKLSLEQQAQQNADKEEALNQYQQMIRNIINANILAKSQIVHRDQVIVAKDATIDEKKKAIVQLQATIQQNQDEITQINTQLADKIQNLKDEQAHSRSSKAVMEKRIASLRAQSQQKIAALTDENNGMNQQLTQVQSTLVQTQGALAQTQQQLGQTSEELLQQEQAKNALSAQLDAEKTQYATELADMRAKHAAQLAAERAAFDRNMKRQQLSHAAKQRKLAEFLAREKEKEGTLEGQLSGLQSQIQDTQSKLSGAENALSGTKAALAGTQEELAGTKQKLAGTEDALAGTQNKLAGTENALAGTQQKLAGTEDALAGTQNKLAGTESELAGTQQKLAGAEGENNRALATINGLQGDLERTREMANARRKLAAKIAEQFRKAGLKGNVNGRTGEVTLDFGQEYFDTGSTRLKPKMRTTLDKFIPLYAKSLFSDPKISDKIGNVEIIGFASSTYKGRYVNPTSVAPGDKQAIEYNLKLSFGRANAIFNHVLSEKSLTKAERDHLLTLMKVVGRGYLPDGKTAAELPEHMSQEKFCQVYNCNQAQKVIVKFNMKD